MTIAVCDDDEKTRKHLAGLIRSFIDKDIESVQILEFSGGKELLEYQGQLDIVIMDIGMNGMNGMETAARLRKVSDTILIFVTAWKDYVFDAFDVGAFHYLLKPVDENKFFEVLERALTEIQTRNGKKSAGFTVKTLEGFRTVKIKDIYYAENIARKIVLHTGQGDIAYYEKMDHLEQQLGNGFFRCHRGYLVSLDKIKQYDRREIELVNGDKILLSRQKYSDFVQAYMKYMVEEDL
ncbi:MAG: response regulator transcription factor [Lachnospiraceae bacterium]|nr:response regulator transcription factor [Lachnospiraceae bacterium]